MYIREIQEWVKLLRQVVAHTVNSNKESMPYLFFTVRKVVGVKLVWAYKDCEGRKTERERKEKRMQTLSRRKKNIERLE